MFASLACATHSLADELPAADTAADPAAASDSCALKRDGAPCTEASPIFQQAMDELNRQRAAEQPTAPPPAAP